MLAEANLIWPMGFGTIKTLFTLLLLNKSTVNKLIRFLPSFDSQRKITKQHGIPVLPELSMVSTCDVYFFWFSLWLLSSSLSLQTSSSVSQTFPNKASNPRVSPALSVRRKARGARLRLRASSGGCGTSWHEASRWTTFPFGLLKNSLSTDQVLYAPFFLQSNFMLPTQRFPPSDGQSASNMAPLRAI